jgi:hypothetical protein
MAKYGIQNGQYYVAADGSQCGHYVVDCERYAECDDVLTIAFDTQGAISEELTRIDAFKLSQVRYYLSDRPDWLEVEL